MLKQRWQVVETVVQRQGEKRLVVEIPAVKDLNQAKKFLGETAELAFKKEIQNGSTVS